MSSLMRGSSPARSTRSDCRKLPCSAGGWAASAAARSSATGRTGWMRKILGLIWAGAAQASSRATLDNLPHIGIVAILFVPRLRADLNLSQVGGLQLHVDCRNV